MAIGLVLVLIKLTHHFDSPQHLPVTAEWIEELSIERYRPMLRLLNQEDLDLLRAQPGFTPQMATDFRVQRCKLLQEYLRHRNEGGSSTWDLVRRRFLNVIDNDFDRTFWRLQIEVK